MSVSNEYATIGGRYYHSNLPSYFDRLDELLVRTDEGIIDIAAWPFESRIYVQYYGIASIIRGMVWTFKEKFDTKYVEDLRTFPK